MSGHHLILGELDDLISGETIKDTLDERYRQNIAELLVHRGSRRSGLALAEDDPAVDGSGA